ncbi:MAG: hypothetical protein ACFE8L_13425, partial [Candidatus Hodarchaeota archaeon]
FIVVGGFLLFYAIKLKKKYTKEHNFMNSFLTFLLWIIAGFVYPFFFSTNNSNIRFFQALSTLFICIFTPGIIFLILFYQYKYVVKNDPNIKSKRNLESFLKNYNNRYKLSDQKTIDINIDLHRKALHLFPAGVVIFLWIFANYIWDGLWNADDLWGISGKNFGRFLILSSGYSGILVFAALDFIRLSFIFEKRNLYHLLPDNVSNILGKTMKRNEIYEYTRPAVIALSFIPIFFLPFGLFCAAILIATIGDGAASIFGLKFGKKNFPKSSKKTIIGYIAGFIASFGISIFALWLFEPKIMLTKKILISISGAIMFFLIDIINLKIDDNILNPIFCGLLMWIVYISNFFY